MSINGMGLLSPQMPPRRNPTAPAAPTAAAASLRSPCAGCGAPWEPVRCSFCLSWSSSGTQPQMLDVTRLEDTEPRFVEARPSQTPMAVLLHEREAVITKDQADQLRDAWGKPRPPGSIIRLESGAVVPVRPPQPYEPDSHDWAPWRLALTAASLAIFLAWQVARFLGAL